ncbi:MAG TPA: hypothetical protein DDZ81_07870 [Acetobacteraceae bacterium]|jgi:hypothetical protein|nr:hypothetical protein [Acetobacteraceae bacterium]
MADISDVEGAVSDVVTSILYPNGSAQASVVGSLCRIYRGWPTAATLNADLTAGVVNITVNSDNDAGRITTRYLQQWQTRATSPGTTVGVSGQTLTISGVPAAGDAVGVVIDGVPHAYRVQPGDSVDLIAANLGQAIQATRMANYQGFAVTIPGAHAVSAHVVCDSLASVETRRQEKDIRIACWCPTPSIRDAVGAAIDTELSGMAFLPLPDGTQARVSYRNTQSYDQSQNALLYRRDLVYTIEYATIDTDMLPSMLFGVSDLGDNTTYI